MVHFIAHRIAPEEADELTAEVERWIVKHLGRDYPWLGNFRELEQCVRNVLLRNEYRPLPQPSPSSPSEQLAGQIARGELTADQLLRQYCAIVYAQSGNLNQTARQLGLDRRTVKSKLD